MKNFKSSFFSKRFYLQFLSIAFLFVLFLISCSVQSSNNDNGTIQETRETTTETQQIDDNTKKITDTETVTKQQERDATQIEIQMSGGKTPYMWVWVTILLSSKKTANGGFIEIFFRKIL